MYIPGGFRWGGVLERILQMYEALKSYFQSTSKYPHEFVLSSLSPVKDSYYIHILCECIWYIHRSE